MIFNYLPLLIVFGSLAVFDILGKKRINLMIILLCSGLLLFMNGFIFNSGMMLVFGIVSSVAILLMRFLGIGDKIVLIVSLMVYDFYWIWIILILAIIISRPAIKIKSFFNINKSNSVSVAFYPYLFISTLIIVWILSLI